MNERGRIYLDHAATSWPKPEAVYVAMDHYSRSIGAAAGRGDYRAAVAASEIVQRCRRRLMQLINANTAQEIAFFSNGTTALNAAIFGVVRRGDHIITSAIEHNSVLRPLEALRTRGDIELDVVPCNERGFVDVEQLLDLLTDQTSMVALAHASNVTGAVQEIAAIGEALKDRNVLFLCDAAQTLGYLKIDVQSMGIDLLAAPGHKGAWGPLGTGMLYVSPKALMRLTPTVYGGTGSISESLQMPDRMPEMLEAGNLNVPAIAGWEAGLEQLQLTDTEVSLATRTELCRHFAKRFGQSARYLSVIGTELPIASLVFDAVLPQEIGGLLDSEYGIDVRCGLHCAARVHEPIEKQWSARNPAVEKYSGTLRISAGHASTTDEVDAIASAIDDLLNELV